MLSASSLLREAQRNGSPSDSMSSPAAHLPRPGTAREPSFLSVTDRGSSLNEKLPGSGAEPANGLDVLICCPISKKVMSSAVLALDGHTCERQAIESWFGKHGNTSPVTG